ncbi:MAG: c-type cytochrome [Acidobacteria bacterium]|nr:c-type cytochrome [Acidobacteriota bacterium]
MKLEPGWSIAPFAAEPMVVAPVAMDWDEDGRIYVVENPGYPLNVEGRVGRVKMLEDSNNDGTPDRATVFAEGLVLPTGVMRWKNGILVTDAPDIWYLEDSNGDGKADIKRKLLTGFPLTNPQHTVNGLVYGLDNWIYIAHENPTTAVIFKDKFGDRGTDVHFVDRPTAVVRERGRNLRFRPDTFEIEALSGTSQFGHAFDEWGHHFVQNNSNPARHEVIAARYLKRNPDLALPSSLEDMPDYGRPARVFPIAPQLRFEMLTNVGEFTSACGLTYWPGGYLFTAEPAHNLVHRVRVSAKGPTFAASRTAPDREFLASTDPWFRPVNFYIGPDGALYMLDYYRLVIEHPEWMSQAQSSPKDLNAGNDRGRIYRLTPPGFAPTRRAMPGKADSAALLAALADPNPWWRRTAQRLIQDRRPAFETPAYESVSSAPGRVHMLWTLEGLGRLTPGWITQALRDPEAGVRENAIVLAEARPALHPALVAMANDPDPRVRFQLLAALGSAGNAHAVRGRLLDTAPDDRWMQAAALTAGPNEALALLPRAMNSASFARLVGSAIGTRRQPAEIESAVSRASQPGPTAPRAALLEGLAAGVKQRIEIPRGRQALVALAGSGEPALRRGALRMLEAAGAPANTPRPKLAAAAADRRADAIWFTSLLPGDHTSEILPYLDSHQPEDVQIAAARALGRVDGEPIGREILRRWRGLTPSVRLEAGDALYRDPARAPLILAALKGGELPAWTLAFRHRRQLQMHRDPEIRGQARALLESAEGERAVVVRSYQPALNRDGNPGRGQQIFEDVCAKCHRFNGRGAEVGPDLATVRHQPKQVLLEEILDPSRAISQGFESYVVETTTGITLDGVIGPQTASSITLRQEQGKEEVILRKDIRNMYAANLSAMPADLEKQISPDRMADLLAYIKSAP